MTCKKCIEKILEWDWETITKSRTLNEFIKRKLKELKEDRDGEA